MKSFIDNLRALYKHRDLMLSWTYRLIRGRYQQSILGGLWAVIVPTASTVIFSVIFTFFVPIDTGEVPYFVFSYTAMIPWTFFTSSISEMSNSLIGNMNLVSKIYFPREILPIATVLARLLDFLIGFCMLVILMFFYKMPVNLLSWLFLPIVLLIQIMLSLGIGLAGAAMNVFYRDVSYVIGLGLQIWLYASPILYPVTSVPERFRSIYFLNPMAGVIESYRAILLHQTLPSSNLILSAGISIVMLFIGYWIFKKVEFQFADVI